MHKETFYEGTIKGSFEGLITGAKIMVADDAQADLIFNTDTPIWVNYYNTPNFCFIEPPEKTAKYSEEEMYKAGYYKLIEIKEICLEFVEKRVKSYKN